MQRKCDSRVTETKPRVSSPYSKQLLLFYLPDALNSRFEASRETETAQVTFLKGNMLM